MVSLILKAADALAAVRPGTKLEIANIARRGGGRIPWSVSHQTGRDADILFPLLSEGAPYMPGAMIHLDEFGAGLSAEGRAVQLDVPGLTAVVRALVEQESVGIRHLFIARGLRQMVLDHAESAGIQKMTVRRMAQLLKQPRGSLPHNDHLHLRIRCAPDDIIEGCSDMGSQKKVKAIREPRVRELLRQITLQRGAQKAANLSLLKRLAPQDKRTRALLIKSLGDRSADVRRSALHGLVGAAGADLDRELAAWLRRGPTPRDISRAIAIVEKRTDKKWTRTIRALMASPEQPLPSTIGGLRSSVGEGVWLAGVTADSRLLSQVLALRSEPGHRLDAQRAAARILIPPPTETSPEQMDILWDTFSSLDATQQAEMIQGHLLSWGLVDEEGRVDRFACYEALLEVDDAQFHAARRLLDLGHPKACRCPRWSRADLRYYWRRRL